ncbi:hypothetical protein [Treponema pedis]|uniref:hypothetical protein n=1 Tax=Treponema pedis TaxID=409322 RepID=UPI0012682879|nr:hypothetical protein [Treponema pedis]
MNLIISFAYAKFIRLKPPPSMAGEREKLPAGVAGIRRGRFFAVRRKEMPAVSKELDEETDLYYYGAGYSDSKYSRLPL